MTTAQQNHTSNASTPVGLDRLPVLDFSQLRQGEAAQRAFREQLREVTHDVGFFYLTGHGISAAEIDRAFDLTRQFFALPDEDKLEIEMVKSPHFRGYNRTGMERTLGKPDWREQLDIASEYPVNTDPEAPPYMRLRGPNQWPSKLPELKSHFQAWEARCTEISERLLEAWALSLGAPADFFDDVFLGEPSSLIKLVRYPGRKSRGQGVGAHNDSGILTLLMVEEGKGGLQVEYQDRWIDVPPLPGAFVVNIGEMMEYATDGYLKATAHRVITPPENTERLSIPFFYNPALQGTVKKMTLPPELKARARGVTQDPNNPIFNAYGLNALKGRLRAHPDVAERHHADLLAHGFEGKR